MTDDVSLLVMVGEGRPSTTLARARTKVVDARIREHDGRGRASVNNQFRNDYFLIERLIGRSTALSDVAGFYETAVWSALLIRRVPLCARLGLI